MLIELITATMINPEFEKMDLLAYSQNQPPAQTTAGQRLKKPFNQSFFLPPKSKYYNFFKVINDYQNDAVEVVTDFQTRKDNPKQFLKWVDLPYEQTFMHGKQSHLDKIYTQAQELKSRGNNRPLVVLGIGGSKHTAEFLLNMNGYGNKGNVYFYSDIDPISFENFIKEVNRPIQDMNFLVVSKSGTTFETKDAFVRFENLLTKYYKEQGQNEEQAKISAQKHFAICTDKKATDKNLRGIIGSKNGKDNEYIKELYIHDGVGGRFSMFDDAGLFTIAYSGVQKETAVRILKSAEKTSKLCLSKAIYSNPAMLGAIYNIYSKENGYKLTQEQFFGHLFENAGENWIKQLYLESLKDFDFVSSKAPDSMHYASEGFFFPENRDKYNMVMTAMTPDISANYKKYVSAIIETYSEKTPVKFETLDVANNAIKPEAIGEYIQTKHFEVVFTGMLQRQRAKVQKVEYLPEVFQPNVETYKNKFKPQSKYELNPGQ